MRFLTAEFAPPIAILASAEPQLKCLHVIFQIELRHQSFCSMSMPIRKPISIEWQLQKKGSEYKTNNDTTNIRQQKSDIFKHQINQNIAEMTTNSFYQRGVMACCRGHSKLEDKKRLYTRSNSNYLPLQLLVQF